MKYLLLLCAILFACCVPAAAEQTYEHASAWECNGIGWGGFSPLSSGVAADAAGNVYVADTDDNRILKFDKTGAYLVQWGTPKGIGPSILQQLAAPTDIVVNSKGAVYVSDRDPNGDRIKRFSPTGVPYLRSPGDNSWGTGSSNSIGGLGIDRSDNIYVADTGNNRILKFTSTGTLILKWGRNGGDGSSGSGDGEFDQPTDVAVDANGNVFVADKNNHRVQIFSLDGAYKGQWSGPSDAPFVGLWGIATDADGNVLVTDEFSNQQSPSRAWVFTARDTTLANWDGYELPYTFYGPRGIAADSAGAIYVVNAGGSTPGVEKFVPVDGPTLTISGNPSVDEGTEAPYTLNMAATNLGEDTIASWSIDWGDGTKELVSGNPGSVTHAYADGPKSHTISATATVSATATHGALTFNAKSIKVTVNNIAPTLNIAGTASVNEGAEYTLSLSSDDPGADTIASWSIDWGDGTKEPVSGNPGSVTHAYADGPKSHTISAQASDEDGIYDAQNTVDVTVANVAPTLDISGAATVAEGSEYTLSLRSDDPGADTITSWEITWGDGTIQTVTGDPTEVKHIYADGRNGYQISAKATDDDGTFAAGNKVGITVNNVDPAVVSIDVPLSPPLEPIRVGTPITATVTFSDPGTLDTHTVVWNWGDGSESSESVASGALTGTTTHTYTTPGIYSPSVTVTDKDAGRGTLAVPNTDHLVIYNPNGGSATGGGWFTSPAGACRDQPGLTGRANFAFTTRYKTDATVPESSVEFRFKPADFDFKSTSCEWLIVADSKATYRGIGTLNGAVGYGFLLTAMDNQSSDMVRMKIWDTSGHVIYDSQPGAPDAASPSTGIGGGSIVVHP